MASLIPPSPTGNEEAMVPAAAEVVDEATSASPPEQTDVVLVHGITSDGAGLKVLRHRDGNLEAGAVRAVQQGRPIYGELVRLTPRQSCPLVCDVTVELAATAPPPDDDVAADGGARGRKGPAQIASDRYRANWDAIWSRN